MSQQRAHLRKMTSKDLPTALRLVKSVGWNQTEQDLRLFLEGENNIYLAAEIDDEIIGTVASITYGNDIAWISMMIVTEAFRGRGVGKLLLHTIIKQLESKAYRTIKLDATPAGRPVYLKLGFKEAYTIHRFIHPQWPGFEEGTDNNGVRKMELNDLPAVIHLDKNIFGAPRKKLFDQLIRYEPAYVLKKEGQISAYALGRKGRRFHQLGPAGGHHFEEVHATLKFALQSLTGQAVVLDVPADKQALIKWLNHLGFQFQRPLYRMYLHFNHSPGNPAQQFCIAGPEFG